MPPLALPVIVTFVPFATEVELTVELFVRTPPVVPPDSETLIVNFLDLTVPALSLTLICTS